MFNGGRLVAARKRRHLTAKALAAEAGIAPLTVTRLERGQITSPNPDTVESVAKVLGYPTGFFFGRDLPDLGCENVSFRSMSAMSAAERDAATNAGKFSVLLLEHLKERFNLPAVDLPDLDEIVPADVAARLVRQKWGIGDAPIPALIRLFEAKGIRIFSLREQNLRVDAFSFWWEGEAYILLNNQKSAERMLYDAAHELGHLVLHRQFAPKDTRQGEKEANEFASAFLMPEADLRAHRPRTISPAAIIRAKLRWRVSAMALTYRLHALGMLTDWQSRSLYIQLGQMGYRAGEPQGIERETSSLWPMILGALWQEGKTRDHLAVELDLPASEVSGLIDGLIAERVPVRAGAFVPVVAT